MSKRLDIKGQRYGHLVAISFLKIKNSHAIWTFQCDCGNKTIASVADVRRAHTVSCGCFHKEHLLNFMSKLPPGMSNANALMRQYKFSAKERDFVFALSTEEFVLLTSSNCHYCGCCPVKILNKSKSNGAYTYNGIDRMDNENGYYLSNCVPCCTTCNRAKGTLTYQEFIKWINGLTNFQRKERK